MDNRLYRSRETKMLAGICGGIADMFNMDPTLVRLIAVAIVFLSGFSFILVYLLCALIIPQEPSPGYIRRRHHRSEDPVTPFSQGPVNEPAATAADQSSAPKETAPPQASEAPAEPFETEVAETPPVPKEETPVKTTPDEPVTEGTKAEQESLSNDDTVINTESDRY